MKPFHQLREELNLQKKIVEQSKGLDWWIQSKILSKKYSEFDLFMFQDLTTKECEQLVEQDKELRTLLESRVDFCFNNAQLLKE